MTRQIGIIGGGPAALMTFKRLVATAPSDFNVHIFEASDRLGSGMPYSDRGAGVEHVTNVSADELPELNVPLADWVKSLPTSTLEQYGIDRLDFHEKKVLPRLLFGQYLSAQFDALLKEAAERDLHTIVHCNTKVSDISEIDGISDPRGKVTVTVESGERFQFDYVVICTGHHWPVHRERDVKGYFDSPYPPSKLARRFNHTVAVRGSSLTAIDAIRTMARNNGCFVFEGGKTVYKASEESNQFRVVMHSRHGLLPCVRVHMEEPHAADEQLIPQEEIARNIKENNGFLELDFLFERGFKHPLKTGDPNFYEQIKDMNLETFVEAMMNMREAVEPFALFEKEYQDSKLSIREERPVYWKEMLSSLSFAMNYPAKHLSAEDMLRLRKHLLPLISVVIAFVPQSSCEELMALHEAGRLDLFADGDEGRVEVSDNGEILYHCKSVSEQPITYEAFVDCTGQRHLPLDAFPFKSLVEGGQVSGARLQFKSSATGKALLAQGDEDIEEAEGNFYLQVAGADITDNFQAVDTEGKPSEKIYLMAVPYMGGFNPDYSGLDFCEHASKLVVESILSGKPDYIPRRDVSTTR